MMGALEVYSLTASEIEDIADTVKVGILDALARDRTIGLDEKVANDWAATHTVIVRKKTVFRTLTSLWKNTPEANRLYYIVVEAK